MVSILDLPNELLTHIVGYLIQQQDILAFNRSSKCLHHNSTKALYTNITLHCINGAAMQGLLTNLLRYTALQKHVRRIRIVPFERTGMTSVEGEAESEGSPFHILVKDAVDAISATGLLDDDPCFKRSWVDLVLKNDLDARLALVLSTVPRLQGLVIGTQNNPRYCNALTRLVLKSPVHHALKHLGELGLVPRYATSRWLLLPSIWKLDIPSGVFAPSLHSAMFLPNVQDLTLRSGVDYWFLHHVSTLKRLAIQSNHIPLHLQEVIRFLHHSKQTLHSLEFVFQSYNLSPDRKLAVLSLQSFMSLQYIKMDGWVLLGNTFSEGLVAKLPRAVAELDLRFVQWQSSARGSQNPSKLLPHLNELLLARQSGSFPGLAKITFRFRRTVRKHPLQTYLGDKLFSLSDEFAKCGVRFQCVYLSEYEWARS